MAGPVEEKPPHDVAGNVTPLSAEMLGGVAERAFWDYADPDLARESYTMMEITGCSSAMVGPNVMMTASHCGTSDTGVWGTIITYDDQKQLRGEKYWCKTLLTTFSDTDLSLWYCADSASGPPGLKYGYGDFNVYMQSSSAWEFNYASSRSMVTLNKPVDRFWTNPIVGIGIPGANHNLYGTGTITGVTNTDWMVPSTNPSAPSCDENVQNIGVTTNVFSTCGASGSSHWSQDNHRIIAGPETTGPGPLQCSEGPYAGQLSVADYIWNGWVLNTAGGCAASYLNSSFISTQFSLNASSYYGWVDDNLDGVFDIQKDTESVDGEFPRDFYWLGFESNRRNMQWIAHEPTSLVALHPNVAGNLTMTPTGTAEIWWEMASRYNLNLAAGTYVVSFDSLDWSGPSHGGTDIRVCIGSNCWDSYANNTWAHQRRELAAGSGDAVHIWAKSSVSNTYYVIRNLVLQRKGSAFTFDTADERQAWRGRTDADIGLFWPDGIGSISTSANFAAVITRDGTQPLGNDWSARTRNTGMKPWQMYRICYSSRDSARDPQTLTNGWVGVRVIENISGAERIRTWAQVPRNSGWTAHCSGDFYLPTNVDAEIEFGIYQAGAGSILVDNVQVVER